MGKDAWRIFGLIFLSLLASYKNKNEWEMWKKNYSPKLQKKYKLKQQDVIFHLLDLQKVLW